MKAWTITRYGSPEKVFSLLEHPDPKPGPGEIAVEVAAFGLNYADIMARNGMYRDAPKLPMVVGYEVVGRVAELGEGVTTHQVGDRVAAFTRFGGYATRAVMPEGGAVKISEAMPAGEALALCVQYVTAWFCAVDRVQVYPGDHVLIQAAAGGVGTALVQLCRERGAIMYGTAGSAKKLDFLREQGVQHPINYREVDFDAHIRELRGDQGLDIVFDSLGGKAFKKGFKLLRGGGRIVGFGAASRSDGGRSIISDIRTLLGYGFYAPPFMLMASKSVLGVNMLTIADQRPEVLRRCLEAVVELWEEGKIKPVVGGVFKGDDIAGAHRFVEERKSMGKVIVEW